MKIYTVYKIRPARYYSFGTCIHRPVFATSWKWLATIVSLFVYPRCVWIDPAIQVQEEHVDDEYYITVSTKQGNILIER